MALTPFLVLLPGHAFGDAFLVVFLALLALSQHFHALAHMKKSQLPAAVVTLQDARVILGRRMHGQHHKAPYDVNYCIASGLWNPWLHQVGRFQRSERFIHRTSGVAPRAWSETPGEAWRQREGDSYFEDCTDFDPSQSS